MTNDREFNVGRDLSEPTDVTFTIKLSLCVNGVEVGATMKS